MPRNRRPVSENPDGDDFSCRRCATGGMLPPALRTWFLILISHIPPYSLCNMRKFWLNCGAKERNSYAVVRVVAFDLRLNSTPNSFGAVWRNWISPFPPRRIFSPTEWALYKGCLWAPLVISGCSRPPTYVAGSCDPCDGDQNSCQAIRKPPAGENGNRHGSPAWKGRVGGSRVSRFFVGVPPHGTH